MLKKLMLILLVSFVVVSPVMAETWVIDDTQNWKSAAKLNKNLRFEQNAAVMKSDTAVFKSVVKRFSNKRKIKSVMFEQSMSWNSWTPITSVGPSNLRDAPVFLTKGPNDYWLFGQYGSAKKKSGFNAKNITVPGYDIPLKTTPFLNQYDAKGGLKKSLGGYHAWQSKDMVTWIHHGPVTEKFSRWVTSAEYVDGKTYLFYDYPNDQDPHLYIDNDLMDGQPGKNMGMIFKDPSHGSDSAFFRETDGSLHVIYEDWSPINASKHAWDSPLAGHAVSENGLNNFKILPPVIDVRTEPTGKTKKYNHPHWMQHKDWNSNIAEYQEHLPVQDAFGDWAMIKVGTQYYLFGDYDHAKHSAGNGNPSKQAQKNMSIARFTTNNLNKEFELVGDYGKTGHPDPDIGFAEGKFYLITQTKDFVSDGPWVDGISARAGVDIDNDGEIDHWTNWQKVTEKYQHKKGFAKHVETTPATIDLSQLPAGYGVSFEFTSKSDDNGIKPKITKVSVVY